MSHLPCPRCGSDNVRDDYSRLVTSSSGIDYQSGWIDCEDCGLEGSEIHTKGEETERLREMVWAAWDDFADWKYKGERA